jgi:hypothetical protein
MKLQRLFLLGIIALSSAFVPQAVHATNQIIIDFDTVPTGLPSPDGSGPWLRAMLTDLTDTDNDGDVDGVQIDLIGKFTSPIFVS